jgi:alkylation response protein AidB-like acyl-CoA dehydrogenase
MPALRQEVIWCQLFSEPDAGSDAAGIKTRGTRVEGGWLVNGQKVWTSGAH